MSNTIRAKYAGGLYFFTLVTFNRRPFLTSPLARKTLRFAWQDVQSRYPFEVEAICLLPDHLHCIWRLPENDVDFSQQVDEHQSDIQQKIFIYERARRPTKSLP